MTMRHFSTEASEDAEGARDLRLVLAWTAALLFAGSAANFVAIWFGAGQP